MSSHTNPCRHFRKRIFLSGFVIALLESNFQTIRFRCPDFLGSLSNAPDDGDGNENGKLQKVSISKTTTFMCITLVRTFLCRRCTTTTWKYLISRRLVEDVNTRQRFFFSLPELRSMQSFRICRIERREKDAVKFETERKSSSETHRHIKGARESLNGRKNKARR